MADIEPLAGSNIKKDSEVIISLKDVSKGFDTNGASFDVLKGVFFDIKAGETIAVVGASGIGKSTLLNIIGTLDKPDKGNYLFFKQDIFSFNDEKLAKFRNEYIGFVFQFHHLLPEFSAIENVMMPFLIKRIDKKQAYELAADMLIKVGLENRLKHKVNELSGGEQQRVAIARALIMSPPVLLADEPTGNLDKKNSENIHKLLLKLNQELKMTVLVVTHNIDFANYMSRKVTLVEGQIEEVY